jgi:hypothetical protein
MRPLTSEVQPVVPFPPTLDRLRGSAGTPDEMRDFPGACKGIARRNTLP